MTPPLGLKAALLVLSLANSPAFAFSEAHNSNGSSLRAAVSAVDAAMSVKADNTEIVIPDGIAIEPPGKIPAFSFYVYKDQVEQFLHARAISPMMRWAKHTGEWISSSSGAIADAARTGGEWAGSYWTMAMVSAQNAGERIVSGSYSLIDGASAAASSAFSSVTLLEDWSAKLVKKVESHLHADDNDQFAALIKQSGFMLADVKVGVGIIPELALEFRHERDLTPAETEAFRNNIEDYTKTTSGPVSYFEGLLLRNLSKAGEYSGDVRISEVHIDVFPLPGLELFFDPLRYEEEKDKMLFEAYNLTQFEKKKLKSIEDRISKIETRLSEPKSDSP